MHIYVKEAAAECRRFQKWLSESVLRRCRTEQGGSTRSQDKRENSESVPKAKRLTRAPRAGNRGLRTTS